MTDDAPPELGLPSGMRQFFGEVIRETMERTAVSASPHCERYLVELLVDFGRPGAALASLDKPFGVAFLEAARASGPQQFEKLRVIGDSALYHSSFFADSFRRRGVELRFVTGLGAAAYDRAASTLTSLSLEGKRCDIFDELAANFNRLVRLLTQVSDTLYANGARTVQDTLELYQRWLQTESPALADALAQRGWGKLRDETVN